MVAHSKSPVPGVFFADPARQYDPASEGRRNNAIIEQLQRCMSNDRANQFLLLASPNGTVFKITVSDAGALTATAV